MKNALFLLAFCFCTILTFGQKVEIIKTNNDFVKKKKQKSFLFISRDVSVDTLTYVATISCNSNKKSNLPTLFKKLRKKGNKLGANAYRISSIEDDSSEINVTLDIYAVSRNQRNTIKAFYPSDKIYLFGHPTRSSKSIKCKINKIKSYIKPFHYVELDHNENSETSISIGGFLGSKIRFNGNEKKDIFYLTLSKGGLEPGIHLGQPTIHFNNGDINVVNENLALFQIQIMKRQMKF